MLSAQQPNGLAHLQIGPHHILYPLGHRAGAGHVGLQSASRVNTDLRDIQFKLEIVIF